MSTESIRADELPQTTEMESALKKEKYLRRFLTTAQSTFLSLPIYHGTDESILRTSIGHLEQSSLPVGGESTHCLLSGHRGLHIMMKALERLIRSRTAIL